jgi:hypothetical protein
MAEIRTLVDVHCWDYDRRMGVASGPVLAPAALVGSEVVVVEQPARQPQDLATETVNR